MDSREERSDREGKREGYKRGEMVRKGDRCRARRGKMEWVCLELAGKGREGKGDWGLLVTGGSNDDTDL